jgi:predicted site-specific integrase-resolvase
LYARVSTKKQEEYLKNQIERLESFAREKGWSYEVISEIASGVNEVNGKENEEDRHRELTEDLIAIVTSFAARVYGSRGGKKKNDNTSVQTGV